MQNSTLDRESAPREAAWSALYTRHQHEKMIAQLLTEKEIEVFLPLYEAIHQWKDRRKNLSLPLFPCYVFLRAGAGRRLDILTTPGVLRFVTVAGESAVIDPAEIAAVRRIVECTLSAEPHPFLNDGDWVRVKSGPLAGTDGILVRKKGSSRLVLSVQMVQQSVAVEVDAFLVEKIPTKRVIAPAALQPSRSNWTAACR
ncbi:MAG: UpxY family transcription antiterminator [Terriglobia bacterium]